MEIERAVARARAAEVHALVLEAQGCVLEVQRQMIETLRENVRLREKMEKYEPTAGVRTREVLLPSNADVAWELARRARSSSEETLGGTLHLAAS